jgi:hypothetical protein
MTYLALRLDESGTVAKHIHSFEEFYDFCHYASLNNKKDFISHLKKYFKNHDLYIFDGNDVWYYLMRHITWEDNDIELRVENS